MATMRNRPTTSSVLPFRSENRFGGEETTVIEGASAPFDQQEFFLPITGFARFYPEEVAVIDHPAFQRLGRINQLGQAHLVFRGGTHKRIEHVLGAVEVVETMIAAVNFNVKKAQIGASPADLRRKPARHVRRATNSRARYCVPLNEWEQRFIRLGALLHDIGHVAAGHTLEDELGLIGKHDADSRLDAVFERSEWDPALGSPKGSLKDLVNNEFEIYVPPELKAAGLSATDIVRLLIRKPPTVGVDKYGRSQKILEESTEIRFHVCANMVGNTVCADLLDYLYRDWYHVGKPRDPDNRIFQYMEIRRSSDPGDLLPTPLQAHVDDRFVIALGEQTKIRTDGVSAILGLLEWRYDLAEMVLFHRTKLAASAMLDRALFELWEHEPEERIVETILCLSDDQLVDEAIREVVKRQETAADPSEQEMRRLTAAGTLLRKLRDRQLFRELATFDETNLTNASMPEIRKNYTGGRNDASDPPANYGARNRASVARELEEMLTLPAGTIAIYCAEVNPKIAEVQIAIDGQVEKFNEYEKGNRNRRPNRLSGGHLEAQIDRFGRLWRIHFFIDGEALVKLPTELLTLLRETIAQVVLADGTAVELAQRAKEKTLLYVHLAKRAGDNGIEFNDDQVVAAARGDSTVIRQSFPNGAPSVRQFIRRP